MSNDYVHGYTDRESLRLEDQANCLSELIHHDTIFPDGSLILEAGCGVGAQTRIVGQKNPGSKLISIDLSDESLRKAKALIRESDITNVEFRREDIFDLSFPDDCFDHILVCFVLEHLPDPPAALRSLKRVLKKGGSVTLIEGDHGSAYYYPYSKYAQEIIDAQITLQAKSGGNALIGRCLYPLLVESGFEMCRVSPRMVYVDSSRPELVEGFTKNTFTAMIEGIREKAISDLLVKEEDFDRGIRDLYRTASDDGVFCYTFFKGTGRKAGV